MVANTTLAALCVEAKLHNYLLYNSVALANSIENYVVIIEQAKEKEYQAAREEGRSPGQYWTDVDPPKALSDVIESIIGAVFVSDKFGHAGTEAVYENLIKPFYDRHISLKTLSHHPTKVLLELFQSYGCQQFEILKDGEITGGMKCQVVCHGITLASATDSTSHLASRRCSFLALDTLEKDPGFMSRECHCRADTEGKKSQKKVVKMGIPELLDEGLTGKENGDVDGV
jgi:endoribonuclease Dicer